MYPLLSMTQVLHRHVGELTALLFKKDAEIQDYKENGAMLSKGAYSIYFFHICPCGEFNDIVH